MVIVPLSHADRFEADIIAARDQTIPIAKPDGTPRVIKWEKVNAYNLASYKKVVDAYFQFPVKHNKNADINCVVVDTSKKTFKGNGRWRRGNRLQQRGLFPLCTHDRQTVQA